MNTKMLASLLVIGAVMAIAGAGTWAVFTDTEENTGTFTSGTIDIAVDGHNPWSDVIGPYQVTGTEGCGTGQVTTLLKPCYIGYINFPVENVGLNPAKVWLTLDNVVDSNVGDRSEPELEAEGGTPVDDISSTIAIDLKVGNRQVILWTADKMLSNTGRIYIGTFEPGESKDVSISFHMDINAGNEYQGDQSSFDIVIEAEQLRTPDNP